MDSVECRGWWYMDSVNVRMVENGKKKAVSKSKVSKLMDGATE